MLCPYLFYFLENEANTCIVYNVRVKPTSLKKTHLKITKTLPLSIRVGSTGLDHILLLKRLLKVCMPAQILRYNSCELENINLLDVDIFVFE